MRQRPMAHIGDRRCTLANAIPSGLSALTGWRRPDKRRCKQSKSKCAHNHVNCVEPWLCMEAFLRCGGIIVNAAPTTKVSVSNFAGLGLSRQPAS
jgi:hypothetical protein